MQSIEARIRKQQAILIYSGMGIIIFGVWSIVRLLLLRYLDAQHFVDMLVPENAIEYSDYEWLVLVIVVLMLLIDLMVRTYIGVSAIMEGYGRYRKRCVYIVVAAICAIVSISVDIIEIKSFFTGDTNFEMFLSAIVDITIHIATIEVVVAAIKLRMINKK